MSNPSKHLEDLGISLEDLKAIAQLRGIKDYEIMSKDELSSIIFPSKKAKIAKKGKKTKTSFSKARIKEIREKFNESRYKLSIHEGYYEPILVKSAFNGNYIQYESRGDKGKNLSIKRYLKMIKLYLSDLINKQKTHGSARYHSGNKSWIGKTSSEWKI